jgi:hypothetical protein
MRYLVSFLAIAAVLVVAPSAAHGAPTNPCTLLTLAEAQSVTHFHLVEPTPNPLRADAGQDKDTTCTYMNDSTQQYVSVMLHDDAAFFPGNAKRPNTEGYKRLKNIGDRAFSTALAMAASIDVLKHGTFVSVRVADPAGLKDRGAKNYADAIALAKLVAGRL